LNRVEGVAGAKRHKPLSEASKAPIENRFTLATPAPGIDHQER
jgi:hypothetical protein